MTGRNHQRWGAIVLSVALALTVLGCGQTEPSRLYTLSDLTTNKTAPNKPNGIAVGVGPVTLPQYLDRAQIVVRQSANRLEASEFDRWAEPLKTTVPRVLTENLSVLLVTDRVYSLPRRQRVALDYSVVIDVARFEPTPTGRVSLVARWQVFGSDDKKRLADGKTVVERDGAPPGDFEAMAALMSDALIILSRDIAKRIAELQ
jgi:hypothetical protein